MAAMMAEIEPTPGQKAHPPVAGDAFTGGTAASRTMFFKGQHGMKSLVEGGRSQTSDVWGQE